MSAANGLPSPTFHVARNITKAGLLLGGLSLGLGALAWWLGGIAAGLGGLAVGLCAAMTLLLIGDRVLLGMLHASVLPVEEAPALASAVRQLAERMEVDVSEIYAIDDDHPRAFALAGAPRQSSLVVTTGFLELGAVADLEGLVAHELAHLRHRDTIVQTPIVVIAASVLELARLMGPLRRAALVVLAPVAGSVVHLFISPKREFVADRTANAATTSPNAVADGLQRLDRASGLVPFSASPATEPLYTIDPFDSDGLAPWFSTHPPLPERLARLGARAPVQTAPSA